MTTKTLSISRFLILVVALAPLFMLPGCCGCCEGDASTDMEEMSEAEARTVLGWRFMCHDDEHYPKGVWRGSLNRAHLAAETEGRIHCDKWGCDSSEIHIRAER